VVKIQVDVFWVVTPCNVGIRYLKMEAARTYETSVITTTLHGVTTHDRQT